MNACVVKRALCLILARAVSTIAEEHPPETLPAKGLAGHGDRYYETAVFVVNEAQETVKKGDRTFGVLLQDMKTKETQPKTSKRNGSGFFLHHNDAYYLVTARHVARMLKPTTRIGFVNFKRESRVFVLAKLVGSAERFTWIHHPTTDLSAMKLHVPIKGQGELAEIAMKTEDLYLKTPPRTAKMVVSGFPGGLGTRGGKISPITAVVHLASDEIVMKTELDGIPVDTAYLVNPPAGKGFSGAPIFYTQPDGTVSCAGMLNGAWSDSTGGKFSISVPAREILVMLE